MAEIDFKAFTDRIGLVELADASQDEVATDFMPASVTGLADGDLVVLHEPYTGRRAELYGEDRYDEGVVAQAVLSLALENGMKQGVVYDFQGFAAEYFSSPSSPFAAHTNITASAVRISPSMVVVDDHVNTLERTPSLVVDYGACLTGRSYIRDQGNFVQQGLKSFTYSPLTRLHFTNRALMYTYDTMYGPGTAGDFIDSQLYIGREDGVAGATDEIINVQNQHGVTTEIADIILAVGSQHITREDLKKGIENAPAILKEGGKLIIRSLAKPSESEIGTSEVVGWALDAGFDERSMIEFETAMHKLGSLLLGGHFGDRELRAVILTK